MRFVIIMTIKGLGPKGKHLLGFLLWQSPRGNRVVTHWASMLRWIWSISECNLTTRDTRKRTPMGGPFVRERRGSGPEKQQPKHNPCRPVGRNWKEPIFIGDYVTRPVIGPKMTTWSQRREKSGTCLQCVWQRSIWSVGIQMLCQHDQWKIWSGIVHHKSWPPNMCHTHSWPQQNLCKTCGKSYSGTTLC